MDAETYLTEGYGVRLAIESKPKGWVKFDSLASASAPPRIKQVLVSPEYGTPYLNTSQVFDSWPQPRKWLALSKTVRGTERLVNEGTILVMASATVGRAIVATKAHEGAIISHHFLRVTPRQPDYGGWVYAFLRSPQGLSMIRGSQYASLIRHVEPRHLATLPVPLISRDLAAEFTERVRSIVDCRNRATALRVAAEEKFAAALPELAGPAFNAETGYSVSAGMVTRGRRRLEGAYYAPHVISILSRFQHWEPLRALTQRVWWGKRFKRYFGDAGIPYMSADDVFTMNPYHTERILVQPGDGHEELFVRKGWLIMACSGQTYGLNGSAMIVTEAHENVVFSHDMIRIQPNPDMRPGYLLTALTHPTLGRPLLLRIAYGMSIPHLDPDDVAAFPIVRLGTRVENTIAELAEASASEQARAEVMERELATDAGSVVSEFMLRGPSAAVAELG